MPAALRPLLTALVLILAQWLAVAHELDIDAHYDNETCAACLVAHTVTGAAASAGIAFPPPQSPPRVFMASPRRGHTDQTSAYRHGARAPPA